MTSLNNSSKRRRLLSSGHCLSELPSAILTHTANYLALPSRALFAAALSTKNRNAAAASDERSSAIVGNEWDALDFGDIEKDLASRLSDGDISAVLSCIDAQNKLIRLKLTNCVNITGAGLEPLRGSTTIEQIDLSLVGKNQSPHLDPMPPISCVRVLPILDSILEREGCALRHLQRPAVWYRGGESAQFEQFLHRYNELLVSRGVNNCLKCNRIIPVQNESWFNFHSFSTVQKYTCYECLNYYCAYDCEDNDGDNILTCCVNCERRLCINCQEKKFCGCCDSYICVDCEELKPCSEETCDEFVCKDCITEGRSGWKGCCNCERQFCQHCDMRYRCDDCVKEHCAFCEHDDDVDWAVCNSCGDEFCGDCNTKKDFDAIRFCETCETLICGKCLAKMCRQEWPNENDCAGCIKMTAFLLLMEKRRENKDVRNEIVAVKAESIELKQQIGRMEEKVNTEIKELKEQVEALEEKIKSMAV